MTILRSKTTENQDLSTAILRNLGKLVCAHACALEDGWRAIIEVQDANEDTPYFRLDVQSDREGGDYAKAKMAMLKQYPYLPATGLETPDAFVERIRPTLHKLYSNLGNPAAADTTLDAISALDDIEQMPKDIAASLRGHGLTSYKGAIRIPYKILVSTAEGICTKEGEIRIAFSGAKEWQDLYFAMDIFAALQQSLNEAWPNDQIWFNLRNLQANPQTNMWLRLLCIHEA